MFDGIFTNAWFIDAITGYISHASTCIDIGYIHIIHKCFMQLYKTGIIWIAIYKYANGYR